MPTRNQVEGPPIRTAPSAAAVAGTKTGRKQPRTQEQSTPVQPIDLNPFRIPPPGRQCQNKAESEAASTPTIYTGACQEEL